MKRNLPRTICVAATALAALVALPTAASAQDALHASPLDDYLERPGPEPTPLASPSDAAASGGAKISGSGGKRLLIGFGDVLFTGNAGIRGAVFDEAVAAGGKVVRLYTNWRQIAPASPGPAFDATNPASPEYDFSVIDASVRAAAAHGQRILLMITEAPSWAEAPGRPASAMAGTWKPNPGDVADFGTAVARRYSGNFNGLPRVRDYILWNEPNLESNLTPVWKGKKPAAPAHYKNMLRAFYKSVKAVSKKNRVITAGTAPYGADPGVLNMRPLLFWRKVLCVKGNGKPQKKCKNAKFDVLAHHPINTSGGPKRSAVHPDDLSTPDLKNLVKVLRKAEKAGNVSPKGKKRQVWATELWWESKPPDPAGVPVNRQANYYAEALYLLWKQGASMVLPYQVRDDTYNGQPGRTSFETGVYFVNGKPKPAKKAIKFPFVGDRKNKKKVLIWGVAPKSGRAVVTQKGKGKKRLAKIRVKRGKVFKEKVRIRKGTGKHKLRAKIGKTKSRKWKIK